MRLFIYICFSLFIQHLTGQGITDEFDKKLEQIVKEFGYPGALAAYSFSNGETGIASAGQADTEQKQAMTTDHRMLAGSVGKTFVSAITIMLENEGELSYSDHISEWLADRPWFERLPNHNKITVSHLLSHSAGLVDHVRTEEFAQAILSRASDRGMSANWTFTPEELISFVLDKEALFEPGDGYRYTDTGYILLGLIIEKIANQSYYSLLEEKVINPHHLRFTSPSNQKHLPMLAAGYTDSNNPMGLPAKISEGATMNINPAVEWTGGGLISNPLDLVRWALLLYEGRLLESPYLDDLLGGPNSGAEDYYGYGVRVQSTQWGPAYGHSGWFPGYRTQMTYFKDLNLVIAVQINTDQNVNMGAAMSGLLEVLTD